MAANRLEGAKQSEEPARNGEEKHAAASAGGGMKAWLPLILNIVLMPAIAFGVTNFVLIPKLTGAGVPQAESGAAEEGHGGAAGEAKADSHGGKSKSGKITTPLNGKVLVNVAGTMGTRYLVASMTLVGTSASLKAKVEENDPQLRDAAAGILSAKTINDLEKPGMRNLIRTELISAFNDILGRDTVTEIYLTEFAIQ